MIVCDGGNNKPETIVIVCLEESKGWYLRCKGALELRSGAVKAGHPEHWGAGASHQSPIYSDSTFSPRALVMDSTFCTEEPRKLGCVPWRSGDDAIIESLVPGSLKINSDLIGLSSSININSQSLQSPAEHQNTATNSSIVLLWHQTLAKVVDVQVKL